MFFISKEPKEGYVDIHSHIIPAVDDGAVDMDTSMEMIRMAYSSGTRIMVATPHYHPRKVLCGESELIEKYNRLKEKVQAEYPAMKICLGRELFCDHKMLEIIDRQEETLKMGDTSQLLIEFEPNVDYGYLLNRIREIQCKGYVPILAHIERYECLLRNEMHVYELKRMNVILQVNAMSVTGSNSKLAQKFVHRMIQERI